MHVDRQSGVVRSKFKHLVSGYWIISGQIYYQLGSNLLFQPNIYTGWANKNRTIFKSV